ncbi:MAG: hypothetical protein EHM26_05555 [Desulfobacteraceae bacterium]|nr:MAG: hypothetical protein EHM26_05555 [Desulfobacteraceae bacterium]
MTDQGRTVVAMVSVKAFDDGHLEVNAPKDFLLVMHLLTMAQKTLLEDELRRQKQEQTVIQRPGLRHVMALAKS